MQVFYNKKGEILVDLPEDFDPDSNQVVAKRLGDKYYVKAHLRQKVMFNPHEHATNEAIRGKYSFRDWGFMQVNVKSFEYYIRYLRTNNSMWKILAQRDMINGQS